MLESTRGLICLGPNVRPGVIPLCDSVLCDCVLCKFRFWVQQSGQVLESFLVDLVLVSVSLRYEKQLSFV